MGLIEYSETSTEVLAIQSMQRNPLIPTINERRLGERLAQRKKEGCPHSIFNYCLHAEVLSYAKRQ